MHRPEIARLIALTLIVALAPPVFAWQVAAVAARGAGLEEVSGFSGRIDERIEETLREQQRSPGPPCDDATFIRRLFLDLTGKNPTAGDVVAFLRDTDPRKRAALIDRLLESPACAVHLANTWSAWLLPDMQQFGPRQGPSGLESWLRNRFAKNLRYDRLVADLLMASGPASTGAGEFFTSLEGKPEKIAAKTARIFLGVQLDCAECHDHPFDHWKQRDFWGFAAYFARISADGMQAPGRAMEVLDRAEGEVRLPNTEEVVPPQPLVSTGLSGLDSGTRRQQLTLWLTARENPFLARAAVNRCWSILFGRGLIEPIDDMRAIEMASHPELLRELSHEFAVSHYDLRQLLRTLANTRAYQRATPRASTDEMTPAQPDSYAWMPVKPLTSLQLAACMQQVARDVTGEAGQAQADALAQQLGKLRGDSSIATLGIVQALVTLHSPQLEKVHQEDQSRLLQALTAPHLDAEERIGWLFLSTLCRPPRADELTALLAMQPQPSTPSPPAALQGDAEKGDAKKGDAVKVGAARVADSAASRVADWQSDLLWALINSTEFAMTP